MNYIMNMGIKKKIINLKETPHSLSETTRNRRLKAMEQFLKKDPLIFKKDNELHDKFIQLFDVSCLKNNKK